MKRVGYGRVSTAGQARNGTSLAEQKKQLIDYLNGQIAKIDVPGITPDEHAYMEELLLVMYSNPLKNKLRTILGS